MFGSADTVEDLIRAAYRGQRTAPLVVRMERNQRVLRLTAAPFADQQGREEAAGTRPVVILVEDVTEQRILEAQLIQNDKMASIGQLVSGVAHELNNPLTSIAGLTELLLERAPEPSFPHEHLRVIHDQAERAGRIVRNLLTFARKGVAEKTAVDLNDVASRTSLLIMYELQLHGIELESDFSPEPAAVLGDRYELQQVLLNLVNNAVHAVSQLEPGRPRRIRLETRLRSGTAILRVCDSGPGVPPHLVNYLFTPFFTTKAPGEGTGLGLSLSYGLVKAHGGVLTYEAPPEGGAEFRITLPAYQVPESLADGGAAARRVTADRPPHPRGGRRPRGAPHGERPLHAAGRRGRSGAVGPSRDPNAEGAGFRSRRGRRVGRRRHQAVRAGDDGGVSGAVRQAGGGGGGQRRAARNRRGGGGTDGAETVQSPRAQRGGAGDLR